MSLPFGSVQEANNVGGKRLVVLCAKKPFNSNEVVAIHNCITLRQ